MKEQPDDMVLALMAKYIGNEADASEKEQFEEWLNASEKHRAEYEHVLNTWDLAGIEQSGAFNTDKAWKNLQERIHSIPDNRVIGNWKNLTVFYRVAASVLILIGLFFALHWLGGSSKYIEVRAVKAKILNPVVLPDGSMVFLNKGSCLKYPRKFGNVRTVELTGEAFFKVYHDIHSPFIIQTNKAQVKVLGTSFNVISAIDSVQVVVETGVVELKSRNSDEKIRLSKGNSGVFVVQSDKMVKSETSDVNTFAWRTNVIVFHNADLNYVAKTLSKLFSTSIKFDNQKLKSFKLNAKYEDLDLESIFKALKTTHCLDIKKSGNTYLITGPGC